MFAKEGDLDKYYDQIACFAESDGKRPALSLEHTQAGYFDFKDVAMSSLGLSSRSLSYRISDHYPLWAEFRVPPR